MFRLLLLRYMLYFIEQLNIIFLLIVEDEEDLILACQLLLIEVQASLLGSRLKPVRIRDYVEVTVPSLSSKQFQEHFRMNSATFEILLKYVGPKLKSMNKFSPIPNLDPTKQLLAVLWLLATPDSYRSIAERFDMGKSSLHDSFVKIISLLNQISKEVIRWPNAARMQIISREFLKFSQLPGVIGAIDGTYIAIKAPEGPYAFRYINRKCYHAITLQAVCDANLIFTDVFAGYPSSVSDNRIFKNSDLYKNIIHNRLRTPRGFFIIGDKAYPLLAWCIIPFIDRGSLTRAQTNFNTVHAKSRQNIERAFALLKGRFRRLKYLDMSRTDLVPQVILASCVLHNICKLKENVKELIEKYIEEGRASVEGEDDSSLIEESRASAEDENDSHANMNMVLGNLSLEGNNLRLRLVDQLT